ncbi:MAG: hypothetical protein RL651_1298 [Pseudomonadota bacterium]|jgi:hypothetical protein
MSNEGCDVAKIESLSVAVAPDLFDVLFDSELIATLCMSNLLSTDLWAQVDKIRAALDINQTDDNLFVADIPPVIRAIQKYINKRFTHLHPTDVATIYGFTDLHEESVRFPEERFEQVLEDLQNFFLLFSTQREPIGSVGLKTLAWLNSKQFPAYFYLNVDLINAHKNLTGHPIKTPNGLTSCLDEAALFIAMAVVLPKPGELRAMMVMSSVSHYSAFGYSENGQRWWFNGKNQLYAQSDWNKCVAEKFNGDAQACFDSLLGNVNKITSVSGVFDFSSGASSIPDVYLDEYVEEMQAFFGIPLRQVSQALAIKRSSAEESDHAEFLRDLIGLPSRQALYDRLLKCGDLWASKVFYSYRSLKVADLRPYLLNALRNPQAKALATQATNREALLDILRSLPGDLSVFRDRHRIAMPDETLRLKTGTDRDKGLLLHVLFEHHLSARHQSARVETICTVTDTYVGVDQHWIHVNSLTACDAPSAADICLTFVTSLV